jgi:hypothetical protein
MQLIMAHVKPKHSYHAMLQQTVGKAAGTLPEINPITPWLERWPCLENTGQLGACS